MLRMASLGVPRAEGLLPGVPAAVLLQQDLIPSGWIHLGETCSSGRSLTYLRCLREGHLTAVPTVFGSRYFVRSAEPAGGSEDAEMVDERDTSTWPAVLQVTVWVALQVSSLISTQFLAGLVGQRDTSKSLAVLQVSCSVGALSAS